MAIVGFVGLGVMGGPMAGHLVDAGHKVVVWNRTASKTELLSKKGAHVAASLQELAPLCSHIGLCVARTEDVEGCLLSLTETANPGTIFIDHSTISPEGAKRIHADLSAKDFPFIDAPITGGSAGAINGTLTIFCGCTEAVFEDAKPVMQAYGKKVERVGGAGAGQTTKMANQIAVGGALLALCEALSFAKKAGLDIAQTRDLISRGAAGSWAMENYGPQILARDWSPGFSVKNQRKDFGYCLEAAEAIDAAVPGTTLVDRLLKILEDNGRSEQTTAALFEVLEEMSFSD